MNSEVMNKTENPELMNIFSNDAKRLNCTQSAMWKTSEI